MLFIKLFNFIAYKLKNCDHKELQLQNNCSDKKVFLTPVVWNIIFSGENIQKLSF